MKEIHIKPDAKPIDNVTKFSWDEEDYIEVEVPDPVIGDGKPGLQEQINANADAIMALMMKGG